MRLHPQILVFNESTVLSDAQITAALPAFKHACDYWFEPAWNATGSFLFIPKGATKPTGPNLWELHFLDTSDQAGALGYHLDDNGIPIMRVFAKTDLQYGYNWQVTATHEIFEAFVDAWCLVASQDPTLNKFYGYETGDPVESDTLAMTYSGVKISDFVLPAWFTGDPGPYDYGHHCTKPLEVLPGGYVSIYENGGWTSYQAQKDGSLVVSHADSDRDAPRIRNRNERQKHVRV